MKLVIFFSCLLFVYSAFTNPQTLFKIETDRSNNNCKIVSLMASWPLTKATDAKWDSKKACLEEKEIHFELDANEQNSNTNGEISLQNDNMQAPTRWSTNESGVQLTNWNYICSEKTKAEIEKQLSICP